ncbi:hypothetical protein [Sphingobacterium sp.]|uniref:hypothetical protein n=1 Tax=Sphingobacterium sp. TaxID=341027 RepID=UPI002FDDF416
MNRRTTKFSIQNFVAWITLFMCIAQVIAWAKQQHIWTYSDDQKVVVQYLVTNKYYMMFLFFAIPLLITGGVAVAKFLSSSNKDWETFLFNSFTFVPPFLLIGFILALFSSPLDNVTLVFVGILTGIAIVILCYYILHVARWIRILMN